MKTFIKPEIGRRVIVTGKPFYPPNVKTGFHNLPTIISGTVIKSDPRDDVDSFRLATGLSHFPISVVKLTGILDMTYDDGEQAPKEEKAVTSDFIHTITGSKGYEYVVTKSGDNFSCTCKGFGFNRKCKHINQVREMVGA